MTQVQNYYKMELIQKDWSDSLMMDERETITLYDEEGKASEFEVLGVVTVEDNDYAILIPMDEEDEETAYIFRIDTDEDGDEVLTVVEDDEEFEKVKEAWEALCEEDFEEDYDEENLEDD